MHAFTCSLLIPINNYRVFCQVVIEILTMGFPYPRRPWEFLKETVGGCLPDDRLAQGTFERTAHLLNLCCGAVSGNFQVAKE